MITIINLAYIAAAILFILGLKMLSKPETARRGNLVSGIGMLIAVVVTLLDQGIIDYRFIAAGILLGSLIGVLGARLVKMTSMPQMVALFNGFGGIASLLVGIAEYKSASNGAVTAITTSSLTAIYLAIIIGGVTFTGSLIAYGKLAGRINGKPVLFPGQKIVNGLLMAAIITGGVFFAAQLDLLRADYLVYGATAAALLFGILFVIPIGGADMPVVISLLNSYSGLAACAAGFIIMNNVLIVAGALVGASGVILTNIMCKAMNRSLANVLFSGFGADSGGKSGKGAKGGTDQGDVSPINVEDAALILEAADSVVVVPGYGMAVAQAQHAVRELGELLEHNGTEVRYAIHPVAGRMPGHMNVLLAEANVSYDLLVEPQEINPVMETVDVAIVIGANDVVNPAANEDESSPIYGMPIIDAERAKTVFVLKRSMNTGFAGINNPLFFRRNTRMLFGDAKSSVSGLVSELKG